MESQPEKVTKIEQKRGVSIKLGLDDWVDLKKLLLDRQETLDQAFEKMVKNYLKKKGNL